MKALLPNDRLARLRALRVWMEAQVCGDFSERGSVLHARHNDRKQLVANARVGIGWLRALDATIEELEGRG